MTITTSRFGKVEVDKKLALHFPDGLLGFPENKDFIILEHKPNSPFCWLQSLTSPELAFVMTNPFLIKKDYLEDLSADEKHPFNRKNDEKNVIFAIVTIPQDGAGKTTVNLMGPLVIDTNSRIGRQIILANSNYNHRHPFFTS